MPALPSATNRLVLAAAWPLGIALTSWNYMWRTTPMHRRELSGSLEDDSPPPLPASLDVRGIQSADEGVGPLFHRCYVVRIRDARLGPEQLVERLCADLNEAAPTEFARFHKPAGNGGMRVGDEYVVLMPGPWNGPVRVVDRTPTSFRFVTLAGHLEAGLIEFRAAREGELVVFAIESWARSGDRFSNVLYSHLRMAKEIQLHMWTSFLERVAEIAGGRRTGGVDIETRRVDSGEHGR